MKKVILGAGNANYEDWISTQENNLKRRICQNSSS